jgi:GT2 family glycosyltransferase
MTKASIIIPTYNRLDLLQRCILSIRQHTDSPYEIIVVDNASTDGTTAWCTRESLMLISLPRNVSYSVACNKGLRLSSSDTLVLLNNATVVTQDWLSNLSTALYSGTHIGIVGPVTNDASGSQQVHYPFEDLAEFQRIAAEVNAPDRAKWKRVEGLAGFCRVFHRSLVDKIGLLNERFSSGQYEHDDYCSRARLQGYSILVCHDTLIFHGG